MREAQYLTSSPWPKPGDSCSDSGTRHLLYRRLTLHRRPNGQSSTSRHPQPEGHIVFWLRSRRRWPGSCRRHSRSRLGYRATRTETYRAVRTGLRGVGSAIAHILQFYSTHVLHFRARLQSSSSESPSSASSATSSVALGSAGRAAVSSSSPSAAPACPLSSPLPLGLGSSSAMA